MDTLNSQDLMNIITIIDLATQKGLFKAQDLTAVGQLYEKVLIVHKKLNEQNEQIKE